MEEGFFSVPETKEVSGILESREYEKSLRFTYTINNQTIFRLDNIAIGVQFFRPVDGESGVVWFGPSVRPYEKWSRTFRVKGCIKKCTLVYYVEGTGYEFRSPDTPNGYCARARGVDFTMPEGEVSISTLSASDSSGFWEADIG